MSGYGVFEWNDGPGLEVNSNGPILASNLTANHNQGNGALLNTIGVTAPRSVTLTGVNTFIWNGLTGTQSGLVVNADGNITISNLTASHNYYRGAELDNFTNWDAGSPNFPTWGSVTLTGFGSFTDNGGTGLFIKSHGNVALNRVSADGNGVDLSSGDGITIYADGNVTLVCSGAWGNYDDGLQTRNSTGSGSPGVAGVNLLTLYGFYAYGNGDDNEDLGYALISTPACP